MEGYQTGAVASRVWGFLSVDQPQWSVATAVPEEYADKDKKNSRACANNNASDSSFVQPSKTQFSYRFRTRGCALTKTKIHY